MNKQAKLAYFSLVVGHGCTKDESKNLNVIANI